jgi:DNA-binding MarR family transcriptional regulator
MTRRTDSPATPDPTAPLGGVLDFLKLLWALDHGLQTASREMERRLGVTGPQRMVIRIVGRFPGISAGELAHVLHVHPSTLTGVLRRLETRRLLKRSRDPEDGRRAHFSLTPSGTQLDAVKSGTVEATVRVALQSLPVDRIEVAQGVLRDLVQALTPAPPADR